MYVKMLEDTLRELSGKKVKEDEVEVKLNINAYISDEVVRVDRLRLDLYKRLSLCKTLEEVYEIEKEMVDRFSKLDFPTQNFIEKIKIKVFIGSIFLELVSPMPRQYQLSHTCPGLSQYQRDISQASLPSVLHLSLPDHDS